MSLDLHSLAYFGKVPTHGDFVRRNARSAAWRALDSWMQKGLYWAKQRVGPQLSTVYDAAGAVSFFFDGDERAAPLVGVMQPSRDRVGRAFPFVIAREADDAASAPEDVPVHYEAFFEQAAAMAGAAASGTHDLAELPGVVDGFGGKSPDESRAAYERFLRQTHLAAFWERIWGHADDSRKYLLFKNLLDILDPLRDRLPPGFSLILRFPLCTDAAADTYDASFWLAVTRRLLGSTATHPSFFWSSDRSTERPFMLLALRAPDPSMLAYMLPADIDGDTLCILENLGNQNPAQAALSIPARYGSLLEDDGLTLGDFLDHLAHG